MITIYISGIYFREHLNPKIMENLKTEVIQLSDSDEEIPVLVKRELCATPSLKAPEIQETNDEKNTRNSGSEKEFTKFIEFKKNEIDLKVS